MQPVVSPGSPPASLLPGERASVPKAHMNRAPAPAPAAALEGCPVVGSDMQHKSQKRPSNCRRAMPCGQPRKSHGPCPGSSGRLPLILGDVHSRHGGGRGPGAQQRLSGHQTSGCQLCIQSLQRMEVKVLVPTSETHVHRCEACGPARRSLAFLGSPVLMEANGLVSLGLSWPEWPVSPPAHVVASR